MRWIRFPIKNEDDIITFLFDIKYKIKKLSNINNNE